MQNLFETLAEVSIHAPVRRRLGQHLIEKSLREFQSTPP